MKSWRSLWLFFLAIPILIGCNKANPESMQSFCEVGSRPCLYKSALVQMSTNRGSITFEIYGDLAPVTAGNFIDLVQKGVYDGTVFHRVIKTPVPFVVQGGDPLSKDARVSSKSYGTGSFIDPNTGQARFIPLEMKLRRDDSPRYSQLITNPGDLEQLHLTHQKGSLAMARSEQLDSGSAQFYIALKALPELDGRYSVFGSLIEGMDVLEEIEQGDFVQKVSVL